ncbi:hypothetical protein DA717_14150 [Piscirickettsiaceae bacterium NZ-RLO2]|nr:hypothetical protein DA717_14150 [Piscirickettsiaceae bacterium NZ-RLO2]
MGYCSEVSEVATYLGSMLDQLEEPVYLSAIGATGHEFCLIHQSYELHQQTKRDIFIADDFKSLSEKKELVNAIIADPWIYKASKLSDYQEHIKSAHDFVGPLVYRSFYGKIRTKGYSEELGTARPNTLLEKKLLRDFNLAYQEE